MTSAEVLAVKRLIDEIPVDLTIHKDKAKVKYVLGVFGWWLSEQEQAAADALAAAAKLESEAAELAAYGGIAAAEAGWNALRQHNPKVDRSSGVHGPEGEVHSFKDLSHKLKLNYAAFAFGVLNPGAKLGSPVPEEPYPFKVGDRVRVIRGATVGCEGIWVSRRLLDVATVVKFRGVITDVKDANRLTQAVPTSWLTLVTEPRTWDRVEDIPLEVTFRPTNSRLRSSELRRVKDGARYIHNDFYHLSYSAVNGRGPFVEVVA